MLDQSYSLTSEFYVYRFKLINCTDMPENIDAKRYNYLGIGGFDMTNTGFYVTAYIVLYPKGLGSDELNDQSLDVSSSSLYVIDYSRISYSLYSHVIFDDSVRGIVPNFNPTDFTLGLLYYIYAVDSSSTGTYIYAGSFQVNLDVDPQLWEDGTFGYEDNGNENATIGIQFGDLKGWDDNSTDLGKCAYSLRLYARKCDAGEYVNYGGLVGPCLNCPAGSYCPGGYTKLPCDAGTFSKANSSSCTTCPEGEYSTQSKSTSCKKCSQGTFRSSIYSATTCQYCPATTYGNTTGLVSSNCSGTCPAGYKCPQGTIDPEPCSDGEWSSAGSKSCSKCAVGRYGVGINVNANCTGPCSAGYFCAEGSISPKSEACSQNNPAVYCEEGATKPKTADDGYYTKGATFSTRTSQVACPAGYKCINGIMEACEEGTYQDSIAEAQCKTCDTCDIDYYLEDCGGSSAGECSSCSITSMNVDNVCSTNSVFLQCDGSGTSDESGCFTCSNSTLTDASSNVTTANASSSSLYAQYEANCLRDGAIQVVLSRIKPAVLGASVAGITVALLCIACLIVRKRAQLRRRMDKLDKENQSYVNENELIIAMNQNVNLGNSRSSSLPNSVGAMKEESYYDHDEIDEMNAHRRALEAEVRRLKKEKQQYDANKISHSFTSVQQPRRKQFRPEHDPSL